eukprot:365254-Chlamydomonas_euryale.AAC.5
MPDHSLTRASADAKGLQASAHRPLYMCTQTCMHIITWMTHLAPSHVLECAHVKQGGQDGVSITQFEQEATAAHEA